MGLASRVKRLFVGEPLTNQRLQDEHISKFKAMAILSSDALSSVAYATEEILLGLIVISSAATAWSVPVALAIVTLIVVVTLSYRQTIETYPNGGGAYIVAKENLGLHAGLLAAAALLFDYVMTVVVSVAAGVSAMTSAFPQLFEHRVLLSAAFVLIIMLMNLRGVRESARVFAWPTYLFIVSIFLTLIVGTFRLLSGEIHPIEAIVPDHYSSIALFVVLKAFSSGCTALTGIEAISNSVPVFEHPQAQNAKKTMTWMSIILGLLFLGTTILVREYGVMPSAKETVISQLARGVFGQNIFYYVVQLSTALILFLAANTSYAGFPWLASNMAKDRYLPRQFAMLGDRLVFSNSIVGLSLFAIFILIMFGANLHSMIPLYATGVFMGFTLSQFGMVKRHARVRQPGWKRALTVNFIGGVTTGIVTVVVAATKFTHGAWFVLLLIPALVYLFTRIHHHYIEVGKELSLVKEICPGRIEPYRHVVLLPISGIHRGIIDAIRYSMSISSDVRACYVELDPLQTERVKEEWKKWAPSVPLVILPSPYRSVVAPLLNYIDELGRQSQWDMITVVIPEFVTAKWWHQILHNQTAFLIRAALLFRRRKVVTSVRYHLKTT